MPLWMDEGRTEESVRLRKALVRMAQGEREARGPYSMRLAFALLYGLGAFSLFDPDRAAFFLQRWRFDQAEMSAEGRGVERCAGLVAMVFGVATLFAPALVFLAARETTKQTEGYGYGSGKEDF